MSTFEIRQGDALDRLREMPSQSVHMGITSPPYLALRDYGIPPRRWPSVEYVPMAGLLPVVVPEMECAFGLEPDVTSYVGHLVLIFREVGRVLRRDGSLWLNLGDSYVAGPTGHQDISNANGKAADMFAMGGRYRLDNLRKDTPRHRNGLKAKDLMMVPARAALALQADGWWLRSAITWCKRAPMPESCKDRPTSATEMIYLLTRSAKYYYDSEAVREKASLGTHARGTYHLLPKTQEPGLGIKQNSSYLAATWGEMPDRNMWNYITHPWTAEDDAWLLSPEAFKGAHFATMPTEIPRRAILAGTSAHGCCAGCGGPYKRVVERGEVVDVRGDHKTPLGSTNGSKFQGKSATEGGWFVDRELKAGWAYENKTTGWTATCKCPQDKPPVPAIVLDPFCGAGTTLLEAVKLGRRGLGCELNPEYILMSMKRIHEKGAPLFSWADGQEQAMEATA